MSSSAAPVARPATFVAQSSPHARHFVGGGTRTREAAANAYAAMRLSEGSRMSRGRNPVSAGREPTSNTFIVSLTQPWRPRSFQFNTAVAGSDNDADELRKNNGTSDHGGADTPVCGGETPLAAPEASGQARVEMSLDPADRSVRATRLRQQGEVIATLLLSSEVGCSVREPDTFLLHLSVTAELAIRLRRVWQFRSRLGRVCYRLSLP